MENYVFRDLKLCKKILLKTFVVFLNNELFSIKESFSIVL